MNRLLAILLGSFAASGVVAAATVTYRIDIPIPAPTLPTVIVLRCAGGGMAFPMPPVGERGAPPVRDGREVDRGASANGLVDLFGSVDAFRLALAADAIELTTITPPAVGTDGRTRESVLQLEPEEAAALKAALTCDASYAWGTKRACTPAYDFRVTFRQGEQRLAIDLSLSCRMARFTRGDTVVEQSFEFAHPTIARVILRNLVSRVPLRPD